MTRENSFGAWLRSRRRLLDLTQQALADQAGCARITVRRIESGALKPSRELALILLDKLGIPEPKRPDWVLFARALSGMPAGPGSFAHRPGIPSGAKPFTNLPVFLTTFIGREKEQAQIVELIGKYRMLTLTGSGGIGKTRLSVKVAEQLLADYEDGVWLVELASLSDPDLLPQTVAALFGLAAQSDIPFTEMLVNFLRTKTLLLILDNCEHLLNSCALLADRLLKSCPRLKIIATSREALGIMGEVTYQVPSLQLLDGQQAIEKIREYESIRLFEERCQLVQPDFKLTMKNVASVAQICSRLDGIPLAIELAAGRVNIFSTEQIANQLDECFRILTGGSRTALPRQQTIHASIDWSWNLLAGSERTLLQRLSVFAGGWTLESAEFVCNGDGMEINRVSELMIQLAEKSLLVIERREAMETRYRLLETIRQYAAEKLSEAGEGLQVRTRHLEYFLDLAERAEPELTGPDTPKWVKRLEEELDNIRAALEWSLQQDAQLGLRLANALMRYWPAYGDVLEGVEWLSHLLRQPAVTAPNAVRAKALTALGFLNNWHFESLKAEPFAGEGLALYRALGDQRGAAFALAVLGRARCAQEDYATARPLVLESLALYRRLGDNLGMAEELNMLGYGLADEKNYGQSRAYLEESLELYRALGWRLGIASQLGCMGGLASRFGDYASARTWLTESLEIYRSLGTNPAFIMERLGELSLREGDYKQARTYLEESLSLRRERGETHFSHWLLAYLGYVALRQGDQARARSLLVEAQQGLKAAGRKIGMTYALEGLASLAVLQNQPERAAQLFAWADSMREAVGDIRPPVEQADIDRDLSTIHARLDQTTFAAACVAGRALTIEEAVACALQATHD
jgi:predicted ATPase/DNA-binding XRE family transcriptional regulator